MENESSKPTTSKEGNASKKTQLAQRISKPVKSKSGVKKAKQKRAPKKASKAKKGSVRPDWVDFLDPSRMSSGDQQSYRIYKNGCLAQSFKEMLKMSFSDPKYMVFLPAKYWPGGKKPANLPFPKEEEGWTFS